MEMVGINAAFHDSAAALVRDGRVIAAAEEERFTHVKHGKRPIPFSTYELPFHAIDYCLRAGDTTLAQVVHVAYSFDPYLLLGHRRDDASLTLPLEPSARPRRRQGPLGGGDMTWADLDWPDLSPAFPEPTPATSPPVRPPAPADIAERVHRGEVRRGRAVYLIVASGALLLAGAIAASLRLPERPATHALRVLALVAVGALPFLTFLVAALLALYLGPSWQQRQQHWQLLRWQRARREWLAAQRAAYLASLSPDLRARCESALRQR